MKKRMQSRLYTCLSFIELAIGGFVLVACVIGGIGVVYNIDISALFSDPEYFREWLNIICYIVIGVEFVKMIASHSVDSVIDVLLVALARQMVVEHVEPLGGLFIIIAVSLLFMVRRYLHMSKKEKPADQGDEQMDEE